MRNLSILCLMLSFFATFTGVAKAEIETWQDDSGVNWSSGCSAAGDYCLTTFYYEHDQRPEDLRETFQACLNDESCRGALKGAIIAAGGSEAAADVAVKVGGFVAALIARDGESLSRQFEVPRGHSLCNVRWRLDSNTSMTSMGLRIHDWGIGTSSFAHQHSIGGPGEFIKAYIELRSGTPEYIATQTKKGRCVEAEEYGKAYLIYDQTAQPQKAYGQATTAPEFKD